MYFADDAQSERGQNIRLYDRKVNKQKVSYSPSLRKSCFDRILSHKLIRFFNLLQRLCYSNLSLRYN